jgi:hypothetical protein
MPHHDENRARLLCLSVEHIKISKVCRVGATYQIVVVMAQGLDTGLSPGPPGFDSRLNYQVFFKSLQSFGGDVKVSVPAIYLV